MNPTPPPHPGGDAPSWLRIPGARLDWRSLEHLRKPRPVALAVGMFDGVHLGHQSVIESAVACARRTHGIAAVFTFDPHPSRLFRPLEPTRLLMPPAMRARELLERGIDLVITRSFDNAFAQLPAAGFLPYLKEVLPPIDSVHVGENFRYGQGRRGDVGQMVRDAQPLDIDVFSVDRFRFNGAPVSSSRLRAALSAGEIDTVNTMLGYDYYAEAPVVEGRRLGRTLGFPTLNMVWRPELTPRLGVYAVRVSGPGRQNVPGVANYGMRPTVETEGAAPLLEVHLMEDTVWTTGDTLRVSWHHFIRPEQRFESLEQLKAQIAEDRASASRLLY